jgi:hypothetical protein
MDKWLKRKAPGDPPTPDTKNSIANSVARITNVDRKLSKKSATVVAQPKPVLPEVSKMTVLPPNSMHLILPTRKVEGRVSSKNSILNKASAVLSARTSILSTAKAAVEMLGAAQEISKRNASESSDTARRSNQVDSAHDLKVKREASVVVAAARSIPTTCYAPPALRGSNGKCDNAVDVTSDDSNDENNQRTLNIASDSIPNGSAEGSIKAKRTLDTIPKKASSCLQLMKVTGRDGSTEMDLSDSDSSDEEAAGCAAEHLKEGRSCDGKVVEEVLAEAKPSNRFVLSAAARISAEVRSSRECVDSSSAPECEGEGSVNDSAVTGTVSGTGTVAKLESVSGTGTVAKPVCGKGTWTVPDVGNGSGSSDDAVARASGGIVISSSNNKSTVLTAVRAIGAAISNSNSNSDANSNSSNSSRSSDPRSSDNSSISVGITVSTVSRDSVTGVADVVAASTAPAAPTAPIVRTVSAIIGAVSATGSDAAEGMICTNTDTDRAPFCDTSVLASTDREVNVQGREAVTSDWVGFTAEECGHGEGEGEGEGEADREVDDMSLVMDEDSLTFPPIDTDPSITTQNEILDLTLPSSGTAPALTVPGTLGAKSLGVGEILTHLMEIRQQQTLDDFVIAGGVKKLSMTPNLSVPAPYIRDPLQYSGPLGMLGRKVFRVRNLFTLVLIWFCFVSLVFVFFIFRRLFGNIFSLNSIHNFCPTLFNSALICSLPLYVHMYTLLCSAM